MTVVITSGELTETAELLQNINALADKFKEISIEFEGVTVSDSNGEVIGYISQEFYPNWVFVPGEKEKASDGN